MEIVPRSTAETASGTTLGAVAVSATLRCGPPLVGNATDAASWTKAQWLAQKTKLENRQSRYEKTAADVNAALSRTRVEPDIPPDVELSFP